MSTENTTASGGAASNQSLGESTEKNDPAFMSIKAKNRSLGDENLALKEKLKAIEEKELVSQNNYKQLADQREKFYLEEKAKREQLEGAVIKAHKRVSFDSELGGRLDNEDYYGLVDFDKIVINPDTKKVEVDSVKSLVGEFVKNHPRLVSSPTAKMPNRSSTGFTGQKAVDDMTAEELQTYIKTLHAEGRLTN